jgi:hypothetical protein
MYTSLFKHVFALMVEFHRSVTRVHDPKMMEKEITNSAPRDPDSM